MQRRLFGFAHACALVKYCVTCWGKQARNSAQRLIGDQKGRQARQGNQPQQHRPSHTLIPARTVHRALGRRIDYKLNRLEGHSSSGKSEQKAAASPRACSFFR
jgi:hypothetical protein